MPEKIYSTNILDFVLGNHEKILHLQNKESALTSSLKVPSKTADVSGSPSAAVFVIDQQSSLISGLQRALHQTMKVAAALAEAAELAKDGMIDPSDVVSHARRALENGTVKVSSVNDIFDQSPGHIVSGTAAVNQKGLDPLTSTLRSMTST